LAGQLRALPLSLQHRHPQDTGY